MHVWLGTETTRKAENKDKDEKQWLTEAQSSQAMHQAAIREALQCTRTLQYALQLLLAAFCPRVKQWNLQGWAVSELSATGMEPVVAPHGGCRTGATVGTQHLAPL
ncbi:hypothetical protein TgHK011_006669 [Trichoderma gracile]|nr:hypothetical protein TgHK011_006669 [Trichoderma gracile]